MPRNGGRASGEPIGRKPGGLDETEVGAVGKEASVEMRGADGKLRRYAL